MDKGASPQTRSHHFSELALAAASSAPLAARTHGLRLVFGGGNNNTEPARQKHQQRAPWLLLNQWTFRLSRFKVDATRIKRIYCPTRAQMPEKQLGESIFPLHYKDNNEDCIFSTSRTQVCAEDACSDPVDMNCLASIWRL